MRQAESTLRTTISPVTAEENARRQALEIASDRALKPDFRLLMRLHDAQDAA
jgi:hypothetical protein